MLNSLQSTLQRLGTEVRGAEIAEAAAVLPLMFMMLLGIFWFGQAFSIYGAITRAAQEGARAGAAPYCTTCTGANPLATNAVNAVNAALVASKLNPTLAQPPTPAPVFTACSGLPSCSAASAKVCIQAPVQFFPPTATAPGVCGMSVTFQYPFQFWLPFTSLNKQKIWLTASARVRMETR
jgi:Flp pilus assembly protein TadG